MSVETENLITKGKSTFKNLTLEKKVEYWVKSKKKKKLIFRMNFHSEHKFYLSD